MKILLHLTLLFSLIACGKKRGELVFKERTRVIPTSIPGDASFQNLFDKVLKPQNCFLCHSDIATEEKMNEAWVVPGDVENSMLYLRTKDGTMPRNRGPLPTSDLEIIRNYIAELKKKNSLPMIKD